MSPIDSWDDASGVVFTGAGTIWPVLFSIVAFALFVAFLAVMIRHEKHAYVAMLKHEPIEKGPAVEGEPRVY
ncbi:hypothetical protein [Nocardioides sp. GY 10127]|uniref:hypothetical protein n=1 Tax=Nocardioides sp. GY 10127 TaxID=2569762 RepID=UPI0010A8139C|nr:hypothetical protein [Nocardioides sp. GY 10127]TIC79912.1 hypothetical protein E8D37_14775 [Nocardioides sp. GY 10127]